MPYGDVLLGRLCQKEKTIQEDGLSARKKDCHCGELPGDVAIRPLKCYHFGRGASKTVRFWGCGLPLVFALAMTVLFDIEVYRQSGHRPSDDANSAFSGTGSGGKSTNLHWLSKANKCMANHSGFLRYPGPLRWAMLSMQKCPPAYAGGQIVWGSGVVRGITRPEPCTGR